MGKDQDPLFRKEIVRWYNSDAACLLIILFMFLVFLFGVTGVSVARENVEYHGYAWVAVLLVVMSGVVIVSTSIRLLKRYSGRFTE
ncbi:hypothetical protein ACFL7E_07990 [Thermodesulfobacteriota bacterium]